MSDTAASPAPDAPKTRRAFHPPLVAMAPVLLVFAPNSGLLPAGSLLRPLGVAFALAIALWGFAAAVGRSCVRGATFASVVLGGSFGYSTLAPHLPLGDPTGRIVAASVPLVLVAFVLARKVRDPGLLNVFASLLFALAAFQAGTSVLRHRGDERGQAAQGGDRGAERPDVFYIVLDGYGRHDAMKAKVGYDDAFFVDGLRALGFYVAERSRTNYVQTELSLASSLNMEPLTKLVTEIPVQTDRSPFDRLIRENAVAKTFVSKGYRFVTVTTGFPAIEFPAQNSGYTPKGGLSLLETALLDLTPLGDRVEYTGSQFVARRKWLRDGFSALRSLAGESSQPKFVFAHILAPHPPFVFDADGRDAKFEKSFGYYDASDWTDRNGDRARYAEGYRGQATWTARQTLATVRALVAGSRRPPIIVVQGDHGPKSGLVQNSLDDTDLGESIPNLNAYLVPERMKAMLDPEITPVNSFRVILSGLFGLDLPRRPDRSYFSPFAKPMELTDVTDRVR